MAEKKYLDLDGLTHYEASIKSRLSAEADTRMSADNNLQTQINGLASGSPLVASSTSEMTDTTRVYVNTTDGHWYYYNGSSWADGGVYQAAVIGEESIDFENLTSNLSNSLGLVKNVLAYDEEAWGQGGINSSNGADLSSQSHVRTNAYYHFKNSLKITVANGYQLNIAAYGGTATDTFISFSPALTGTANFSVNPNYYYKFVLSKTDSSNISKTDVTDHLTISELTIENAIDFDSFKATGKALLGIEKTDYDFTFEQGSISSATGQETSNANRIRCGFVQFFNDLDVKVRYSYRVLIFKYDNQKNYLGNSGWKPYDFKYSVDRNCYYRIVIGRLTEIGINPSEKTNIVFTSYANKNAEYKDYNDFSVEGKELFNNEYWLKGDLSTTDGSVNYNGYLDKHSVPIDVIPGKYLVLQDKKDCSLSNYAMFYQEDGTFISYDWAVGKLKTQVPANAKYCMFRIRDNSLGYYSVKLVSDSALSTTVRIIPETPVVKLVAHRGYCKNYPEASEPAYIEAGENKFWGAKIDVCETSDNKFVCSHDATIDRVLDGSGTIANMTLAEVQSYSYRDYPDLHMITLQKALSICKQYGMFPVIEMKALLNNTTSVQAVYNVIKSFGLEKSCLCQCSDGERTYLYALRNLTEEIPIMEWRADYLTNLDYWKQFMFTLDNALLSLSAIDYSTQFQTYAQDVRNAGYPLCMASTGSVANIKDAIDNYGVDLVVTGQVTYEDLQNS